MEADAVYPDPQQMVVRDKAGRHVANICGKGKMMIVPSGIFGLSDRT